MRPCPTTVGPYRVAAVDEGAIADAAEVVAFATAARRARVAASVAAMLAVVALLTSALTAASTVSWRASARVTASPAASPRPVALRACTVRGCYTYVSCLDTSLPKDAACNYWKWDADP